MEIPSTQNEVFFDKDYSSIYDIVMYQIPYESWANYTEDVLSRYGVKARCVLDLACGTGSLSLILAKRGFRVTAIDGSEYMLNHLKQKLVTSNVRNGINVVKDRICDLKVLALHDCAVCYFDSINYIIDTKELRKTFATISKYLRKGALLIFDVNTMNAYTSGVCNRRGQVQFNNSLIKFNFSGSFNSSSRIANMCLKFNIQQQDNRQRNFQESHLQRAWLYDELIDYINCASFNVIGFFKAFSFDPASALDERWTFVVQKIKRR